MDLTRAGGRWRFLSTFYRIHNGLTHGRKIGEETAVCIYYIYSRGYSHGLIHHAQLQRYTTAVCRLIVIRSSRIISVPLRAACAAARSRNERSTRSVGCSVDPIRIIAAGKRILRLSYNCAAQLAAADAALVYMTPWRPPRADHRTSDLIAFDLRFIKTRRAGCVSVAGPQ